MGTNYGKGYYYTIDVAQTATTFVYGAYDPVSPIIFSDTTDGECIVGKCTISAPTGGIAQFKGLTQGAIQDKYVEVICTGVQPWYGGVKWQALSTTGGWMLTCMTGISSCTEDLTNVRAATTSDEAQLTLAEIALCLKDPRYLTWRMMTVQLAYDGAKTWYRTDSHWDQAALVVGSSWGPGIKLSTHWLSEGDNNGTADLGKTYVFALGDGSGVSVNHLSYATTRPATNTTGGTGANNDVTSAPTSFENRHPNLYQLNFCSSTNLLLQGTTDTSAISNTVTSFSDGYSLKSTMVLDTLFGGALASWRGTCLVYYSS